MRSPISIQSFDAITFVYKALLAIALDDDKMRSVLILSFAKLILTRECIEKM
ncbi:MAG: hypothetical protein M1G31_22145 [Pseudanabaena sp. Salubria-1]|nr:hypothetical protein [Pseudanabaena sp. Salubria-1]